MSNTGVEFQKHYEDLMTRERVTLDRLLSANLKPNWVKSQWGQSSLVWCGRRIDANGVALNKAKIQGRIQTLLRNQKSGQPMVWGEEQTKALETIKSELAREVTLSRSGPGTYHRYVDSSKVVAASHLIREHKGEKHLMGFGSHTYTPTQWNYSTPKQEFFAIWKAVKTWHWYLVGRDVVIHTDHQAW
eukprot:TRINITY_DN14444_c0_g1_i1.p1 TRINITY_DN14444_c0_g1~~TRINITY_DN14444_c0_g1_i1.p1  ORF type:complete len:212 (-),score=9.72 TRINITY_DN14444_c0_g1_i1:28-591(-)